MTSAAKAQPRRAPGFRAVALVALASIACTTVRVPAGGLTPSVKVEGDVAEPQVELWVESGKEVTPAEAATAAADARAVLAQALAARRTAEGEQLLVVRAQGVSRTSSRRTDQKAAVAGIAIAAVAIVAVVVVALVATKGKAGGGARLPVAHAAPAPAVRAAPPPGLVARPAPIPVAVPRPPPGGRVVAVPVARPPPGARTGGGGTVAVGLDVQVQVPANGPPPSYWSDAVAVADEPAPPPPPEPAPRLAALTEVMLPPPPPLDVSRRGFFAGDSTRLELTLVDRGTGRPLWVKTVQGGADPRDARAVRELLDAALDEPGGWVAAP